jgi:hypothetical protein
MLSWSDSLRTTPTPGYARGKAKDARRNAIRTAKADEPAALPARRHFVTKLRTFAASVSKLRSLWRSLGASSPNVVSFVEPGRGEKVAALFVKPCI